MHRTRNLFASFTIVCLSTFLIAGCPTEMTDGIDDPARASCKSPQDSFSQMNAATYAVVLEFVTQAADLQTNTPEQLQYFTSGTAFAIAPRLLATNGHVSDGLTGSQPFPVKRVLAIQAGTGAVTEVLRALNHPDWSGDALTSPDVALLTTKEELPVTLPLATAEDADSVKIGDDLALTGFPGDVTEFVGENIPGQTVPQASSLTGTITAMRNFDRGVVTDSSNTDQFQHQIPTTPGTSGSPIVRCGRVTAVNNAGTVLLVATVNQNGQLVPDRVAAANNNFGIHVRHLWKLVDLFEDNALQGVELPPAFTPQNNNNGGGQTGGNNNPAAALAGNYSGGIATGNAAHQFAISIDANGQISGMSNWNGSTFTIVGEVQTDGRILFVDNADASGLLVGLYAGMRNADGSLSGTYAEGNAQNVLANWSVAKQ